MKKSVLATTLAGSLAFATPVLAKSITINSFGGAYEKAHVNCVVNPFKEATGADVQIVTAYSADAFAQVRAQKEAPQFDIIHFSGGQEIVGATEGLLAPIDAAKLSNIGDIYDIAKPNLAAGEGPAYSIAPVGMLVAKGTNLASWAGLMGQDNAKTTVLTDIANGYGMLGFLMMNQVAGGTMDNVQPGLDAVSKLLKKGAIIINTSPEIQQEFAQNGAEVAAYAADYAYTLRSAGLPVEFVLPKEGVPGSYITVNMVAGRDNTDLALKFIDIEISKSAQECMAEALRYTPTNSTVKLSDEVAGDMVYGEEAVSKLIKFDSTVIEKNRAAWVDAWNRTIAK